MVRNLRSKICLAICGVFAAQAFAQDVDDATEQQRVFKTAVANSGFCQILPIDVSQSMVMQNGNPVITNPAAMASLINDDNTKNMMDNCIRSVTNSEEAVIKQDKINPSLAQKLRQAAANFLMAITALANRNQNSVIGIPVQGPVATIGIRG